MKARADCDGMFAAMFALATVWLLAFCATGIAQERHNLLAIDGTLIENAGPYFFMEHGASTTPFAKAEPLAQALGLELTFDAAHGILRFSHGARIATLRSTSDISRGLVEQLGVLTVDGHHYPGTVPMAIVVEGVPYVAIQTIAEALLNAPVYWHADTRVIEIRREGG